jgi:(p)ppGpp synthase/HD superfamily hydrolase
MELMDHLLVSKARKLAERAHAGQVDKAGGRYVEHLRRVAEAVAADPTSPALAQAVAWLHDIVEDTDVTEIDLMAAAMPREVVAAVLAITHHPNEPRTAYYERVKANDLARVVKLADVADNSDPARLALLDDATRERLERKYAAARAALESED